MRDQTKTSLPDHTLLPRLASQALHVAAEAGQAQTCEFILELGVDPNVRCHAGKTPVHYAAAKNQREALRILLVHDNHSNADAVDNEGRTAFHDACWWGSFGTACSLLANGADPTIKDNQGFSGVEVLG